MLSLSNYCPLPAKYLFTLALTFLLLSLSACGASEADIDARPANNTNNQTNTLQTDGESAVVEITRVVTEIEAVEVEGEPVMDMDSSDIAETEENSWNAPTTTDMNFEQLPTNPFVNTKEDNLSTFAIDVDTGSYTIMRRFVTDSALPSPQSVRTEEYVNYFNYNYPLPDQSEAFAIHIDGATTPYNSSENHRLVRVGIQGYDVAPEDRPDALLIFVIDISGSMGSDDRLGQVKRSLLTLVDNLRPTDQIGIVTYGSNASVHLEPTLAVSDRTIKNAINRLSTNGSTNADEGIRIAYQLAAQYGQPGNINRLILCSDGAANVGPTTAEAILENAQNGISLSTFGFGMGGYNDHLMEQLANQGDGSYAYIDSPDAAERVFGHDLTATLFTIAKDAKIQVEFNTDVVAQYRLLGYENRDVADSDFRNDAVDAGEIGAGHSVTALYEIELLPDANPNTAALTVRVRYADPNTEEVNEIAQAAAARDFTADFTTTSPSFQLAAAVAEFAELMRRSPFATDNNLDTLATDARRIANLLNTDPDAQEFAGLVAQAAKLQQ